MSLHRFEISRVAARSIGIERAEDVARIAGIPDSHILFRYAGDRCEVACSRSMALCLAEALRVFVIVGQARELARDDCASGLRAVLESLDEHRHLASMPRPTG